MSILAPSRPPVKPGRRPAQIEAPLPVGPRPEDAAYETGYQAGIEGSEVRPAAGLPFGIAMSLFEGNKEGLRRRAAILAERAGIVAGLEKADALDALDDAEVERMAEEALWQESYESGYAHC